MQLTAPPQLAFTAPSDNTRTLDVLAQFVPLLTENVASSPLYKSFTPNQSENATTTNTTNNCNRGSNNIDNGVNNNNNNCSNEEVNVNLVDYSKNDARPIKVMDSKIGNNTNNYSNNNSDETNVKTNSIHRSSYEKEHDHIDNEQQIERNMLFTRLATSPPGNNSTFVEQPDLQNYSHSST